MYALFFVEFSWFLHTFTFVPLYSFCHLSCLSFLSYCSLAPGLRIKLVKEFLIYNAVSTWYLLSSLCDIIWAMESGASKLPINHLNLIQTFQETGYFVSSTCDIVWDIGNWPWKLTNNLISVIVWVIQRKIFTWIPVEIYTFYRDNSIHCEPRY